MLKNVADNLREVAAFLDAPEGDVQKKFYTAPKIKPPRREPSVVNKTNRSDYMKNYMKDYRENGKDYQKMPDAIKQKRREFRQRQKEKLKAANPLQASLIEQEIDFWKMAKSPVDLSDFEFICNRRGFSEEERLLLAEDLCDLNLIVF